MIGQLIVTYLGTYLGNEVLGAGGLVAGEKGGLAKREGVGKKPCKLVV